MNQPDVIIIGAGIAGASLAWQLAGSCKVLMLEQEDSPSHHSTGRSAAIMTPYLKRGSDTGGQPGQPCVSGGTP